MFRRKSPARALDATASEHLPTSQTHVDDLLTHLAFIVLQNPENCKAYSRSPQNLWSWKAKAKRTQGILSILRISAGFQKNSESFH